MVGFQKVGSLATFLVFLHHFSTLQAKCVISPLSPSWPLTLKNPLQYLKHAHSVCVFYKNSLHSLDYSITDRMSNTLPLPVKRQKSMLCGLLPGAILLSAAFFIASAFVVVDYKVRFTGQQEVKVLRDKESVTCQNECRLDGSEALPKGIVARTTDLQMHPLWGPAKKRKNPKSPMNLLAMAVGKKQKANVNEIVNKFPANDFVIMLFHYDGIVDDWKDLEWSSHAIHISAFSQTKWWFAKRFLHPDVVSEYAYIFLWDEDLGVQNFDVGRYLSIVREEGLQISQPALDLDKSEVHHEITARQKGLNLHRRIEKVSRSGKKCYRNSTDPPCTGWVEMMAPVFSKASWRCTWYMIQNDLIHAWGLDMQLGYCAQGNRTQYIGIVDSEYVVHYGLPTLGGSAENKENTEATVNASQTTASPTEDLKVPSTSNKPDVRSEVRRQSFVELETFKRRWAKAVREDESWNDPYQQAAN